MLAQTDQSVRHGVRFDQHVEMVSGQFGIRPTKSLCLGRRSLVCLIQAESQVRTRRIGPPVLYGDDLPPESQRLGSNLLEQPSSHSLVGNGLAEVLVRPVRISAAGTIDRS